MLKRTIGIFIFLTLFMATSALAQQKEKGLSLSLEDCILKAMENNLGVAIEVLNPELADISVARAGEKFLPSLSFSFNKRDTSSASFSFLDAAQDVSTITNNYSAELSQLIPTGGSFSISLDGYKTESNRNFQTINPRYGSTLTFNFSRNLPDPDHNFLNIQTKNISIFNKDATIHNNIANV